MQFKREKWELRQMQAMPLRLKIQMTAQRIESWYEYWDSYNIRWEDDGPPGVYLSFSGGKDSTVLRHILKNHCIAVYDCPVVFVDTGLEYPEVRNFAMQNADVVLRPKMNFRQVILKYGYPVIGKNQAHAIRDLQNAHGQNDATVNLRLTGYNRKGVYCPTYKLAEKWVPLKDAPFKISEQCCDVMKKAPFKQYEKGEECTPEDARRMLLSDRPADDYTWENNFEFYTTGVSRTGCMFCAFGAHLESCPNRFQQMQVSHPKQYDYCMRPVDQGGLGMAKVLDYIGVDH